MLFIGKLQYACLILFRVMDSLFGTMVLKGIPVISKVHDEKHDEFNPEYVYCMSYGSNLLMSRVMCYIAGGKPDGASRL